MADEADTPARAALEPVKQHRTARRIAIWLGVLAAFGAALWWVLHRGPARRSAARPPNVMPIAIATATARTADLPIRIDAIGTVTPITTAAITSQVAGQVVAVHYQEGQHVAAGTPLVEIDPRPFAAQLEQAQGTLERDQHVLAQARMDLERYRAAWARRAIAKQQLDDQEKLVLQAQGTVKLDRGAVDYNKVQLSYCSIASPIAGRIGLRLVDPGNVVVANTGAPLAIVTQLRPISVVFAISEDNLSAVLAQPKHGEGLPVQVLDRVNANQLATGTLITVDNLIDTTTGTVRLRALFDNRDEALFPNQFVNTKLLVDTVRGATAVPSSAIQRNGAQAFVYEVAQGHAHVQNVTAGVVSGSDTQVTGIAPGTIVATSSFEKLRDGAPVSAGSAANAAPSATGSAAP